MAVAPLGPASNLPPVSAVSSVARVVRRPKSAKNSRASIAEEGEGDRRRQSPVAQAVPAALEPSIAATFRIGVDQVRAAAVVRGVGSQLPACWVGANLNCGKADTRRRLVGATAFLPG